MKLHKDVEKYRLLCGEWGTYRGDHFGAFVIPGPCGAILLAIICSGTDTVPWDHVSVSLKNRTPNWQEMSFVKALFWGPDEAVMQIHPPEADHVNNHNHCLHLWKPTNQDIPMPPPILVGIKELGVLVK